MKKEDNNKIINLVNEKQNMYYYSHFLMDFFTLRHHTHLKKCEQIKTEYGEWEKTIIDFNELKKWGCWAIDSDNIKHYDLKPCFERIDKDMYEYELSYLYENITNLKIDNYSVSYSTTDLGVCYTIYIPYNKHTAPYFIPYFTIQYKIWLRKEKIKKLKQNISIQ